jgi:collagenase-like protein with putative collagen-binding domain
MAYVKALFEPRAWYELVPDQNHGVVTAGYGTFDAATTKGNRFVMTSDYVAAGRTPDGSLVMAYMPTLRTVTVNMTNPSGSATAQWYDPSRGVYTSIEGSPFTNSGMRTFTPHGNNRDGDGDWVLVLETGLPPHAAAQSKPETLFEELDVFVGGQDDINTYRIPSKAKWSRGVFEHDGVPGRHDRHHL